MGFEQYHEPASELSTETRTKARILASLTEEAEAIGWYEQRLRSSPTPRRGRSWKWRETLQGILFQPGDIVRHGEKAEEGSG